MTFAVKFASYRSRINVNEPQKMFCPTPVEETTVKTTNKNFVFEMAYPIGFISTFEKDFFFSERSTTRLSWNVFLNSIKAYTCACVRVCVRVCMCVCVCV